MYQRLRDIQLLPTQLGRFFTAITHSFPTQNQTIPSDPQCNFGKNRNLTPEELVELAINTHIAHATKNAAAGADELFFVVDLGEVTRQHERWKKNLPEVQPYYAVKCNSDPTLLKYLANLGTGFDCASVKEMQTVLDLGVDANRILFANPCKSQSSLVFARKAGILRTTFDNRDELDTIKTCMPDAQLLLRIYANDDTALITLGEKYGAHMDTVQALLSRVKALELNLIGISFHVGTGASDAESFCKAIKDAQLAFSYAQELGLSPKILDIGGGFDDGSFERIATSIRHEIDSKFPSGVSIIAEPGRFYARTAFTLACRIISRRSQMGQASVAGIPDMLYQNDGIYGNFMNVIMEKEIMVPKLIGRQYSSTHAQTQYEVQEEGEEKKGYKYSIWGPTCDSIDCVVREAVFDREIKTGDWLMYRNMGAYTSSTATQFNGFNSSCENVYVNSEIIPNH